LHGYGQFATCSDIDILAGSLTGNLFSDEALKIEVCSRLMPIRTNFNPTDLASCTGLPWSPFPFLILIIITLTEMTHCIIPSLKILLIARVEVDEVFAVLKTFIHSTELERF